MMAIEYRILSEQEKAAAFPKRGQMDLSAYEEMLRTIIDENADAASIKLNGLSARSLKRRVGIAARSIGRSVKWRGLHGGDSLLFKITLPGTSVVKENDGRRKHNKHA